MPKEPELKQIYCQNCGEEITNRQGLVVARKIYCLTPGPCFEKAWESKDPTESMVIRRVYPEEAQRLITERKLLHFSPLEKQAQNS